MKDEQKENEYGSEEDGEEKDCTETEGHAGS